MAVTAMVTAVLVGLLGVYRYVDNFWVYRGFPPPKVPAYVHVQGKQETIRVRSAAIGGRSQPVVVYLPPGYAANPARRYPVMYLLHGFPGRPFGLFTTAQMGVLDESLVAKGRTPGVILVAPFGSTGTFKDKEWANGIGRGQGWETFLARDVVHAIDSRFRTIPSGSARAIAGLSEGGYGALNIAFHHPGEFRVIESWSGYTRADNIPRIFGPGPALRAYNSPAVRLPFVAGALRRAHAFVWFYSGSDDPLLAENRAFAAELARYRIAHHFFTVSGGHTWRLWRGNAPRALLVAVQRLRGG